MIRTRHVKMAARFLAYRLRPVHPFEVQALLLNACNLKCLYCRCPEIKVPLMTTAQWQGLIRGLAERGTMRIKFQGGEPTLYPGFRELARTAHDAGILTAVVTNGLKVADDPSLLDDLDEIVISLDSPTGSVHDGLRGAGSHAQVVKAIELARKRDLPTYVVMVVTRRNLGDMGAMLDFCEARGVRLHAQPVLFGREVFDDTARDLALTDDELRAMHRQLAAWKEAGRSLMFAARTYENVARWPDLSVLTTHSAGDSDCMAGKSYVHLEPNGDIWPCSQHGADFQPKNVISDGLDEALLHVQHHNCGDCFTAYLNERKAVFGLRPAALWEMAKRG